MPGLPGGEHNEDHQGDAYGQSRPPCQRPTPIDARRPHCLTPLRIPAPDRGLRRRGSGACRGQCGYIGPVPSEAVEPAATVRTASEMCFDLAPRSLGETSIEVSDQDAIHLSAVHCAILPPVRTVRAIRPACGGQGITRDKCVVGYIGRRRRSPPHSSPPALSAGAGSDGAAVAWTALPIGPGPEERAPPGKGRCTWNRGPPRSTRRQASGCASNRDRYLRQSALARSVARNRPETDPWYAAPAAGSPARRPRHPPHARGCRDRARTGSSRAGPEAARWPWRLPTALPLGAAALPLPAHPIRLPWAMLLPCTPLPPNRDFSPLDAPCAELYKYLETWG